MKALAGGRLVSLACVGIGVSRVQRAWRHHGRERVWARLKSDGGPTRVERREPEDEGRGVVSEKQTSYELPAVADSIAVARTIVHALHGEVDQAARDDAALLVSELMSNAVRHGGSSAVLTVGVGEGLLRIAVHDDGAGTPSMRRGVQDLSVTSGRGLQIVDRVAQQWGVEPDGDGTGKTVWFELAVQDGDPDKGENVDSVDGLNREDRRVWS